MKEKATKTTKSAKPIAGLAPQASPMMSEPKFGMMNSERETTPNSLTVSNTSGQKTCYDN